MSEDTRTSSSPFRGFLSPNTTQVPDQLFDELLPSLSGAELKVLLYIVRRTFGFKKASDNISFTQICEGIETRDGRRLDFGTGLSRSTAQVALKGLVDRQIVVSTRRSSAERGNEASTYSLNLAGTPYAENRYSPMPKIGIALCRKSASQQTEEQDTEKQQHPQPPSTPGKGAKPGRPRERVVVSSQLSQGTALRAAGETIASQEPTRSSGDGFSPNGTGSEELPDVFGLSSLTNELIARGVSLQAAQHWIQQRTPEYVGELLAYHDWCKEHRPEFIHDHGAWLTASLKTPIDFPERYLQWKKTADVRRHQQERVAEQDQTAFLAEARRHATPPEERIDVALEGWRRSYQVAHRRPPTEQAVAERRRSMLAAMVEEAQRFFADKPNLAAAFGYSAQTDQPQLHELAGRSLTTDPAAEPVGAAGGPPS